MRPKRLVSGGQTGADRGALDAAIRLGIPHGGWCPRGRRAEDGPIPERYRLKETPRAACSVRTEWNVRDSDGTVVFTRGKPIGGSALTIRLARRYRRPWIALDLSRHPAREAARILREWLGEQQLEILNVAGSRESQAPGLGRAVFGILRSALGSRFRIPR